MAVEDYIMTIDSDDDTVTKPTKKKSSKKTADAEDDAPGPSEKDTLNPEFTFDLTGDVYADVLGADTRLGDLVKGSKREPVSVDDIIARRKLNASKTKRKREEEDSNSEDEDDSEDEDMSGEEDEDVSDSEDGEAVSGDEESEDPLATSEEDEGEASLGEEDEDDDEDDDGQSDDANLEQFGSDSDSDSEEETQAEKDRKAAYFDNEASTSSAPAHTSFATMNLSRPILRALTSLNFSTPTPIQAATIPVALLGKDVVGNAVTGSGKTAAFVIPVLERLLYREKGKNAAAVRCVVLVPTRELGVQCYEVAKKLAAHTDIRFALIVGGLSLKSQEAELRTRPDVIVATPGRLIDHLRNSPTFALDTLDILILDEADRMLSDGFADELKEIVNSCPQSRQTMLFSATMTDSVDELVRMSLRKPVRLFVDPKRSTARGLVQEFVRVRAGKEAERSALLVAMCKRTFKAGVIIFFRSKKLAHQMRIVFGLLGMKCEELHGDLTQEQRLRALQQFRDGTVDYLMATDLASRGLDIKGIETVINYDMPGQLAQYLHRVGRTARAGKKGRSVTLVGEADRKMLKAAIKHSTDADKVRHRTLPPEQVALWAAKLDELKDEITAVMKEEKEEKALRQAEMEIKKGENMLEHEKEIFSRPARTWFQNAKDKQAAKELGKMDYEAGVDKMSKKAKEKRPEEDKPKRDKYAGLSRRAKRRKLALEEDEGTAESGAMRAAVRNAKKAIRPAKIGVPESRAGNGKTRGKEKKKKGSSDRKMTRKSGGSMFDRDMGQKRGGGVREGARAQSGDAIKGLTAKKGKGNVVKGKTKHKGSGRR